VGVSGTGIPSLVAGQWEYTVSFPTFIATAADDGHLYRIVVATTNANLSNSSCTTSSSTNFTTLRIIDCTILPVALVNWSGYTVKNYSKLKWETEKEDGPVEYTIERSETGLQYKQVGTVEGRYQDGTENTYYFDDPTELQKPTYYRLSINNNSGRPSYSQIILLQPHSNIFQARVIQNPFKDIIRIQLDVPQKATVYMKLLDISGRLLDSRETPLPRGAQIIEWDGLNRLANGIYTLNISYGNEQKNIRLIKER